MISINNKSNNVHNKKSLLVIHAYQFPFLEIHSLYNHTREWLHGNTNI